MQNNLMSSTVSKILANKRASDRVKATFSGSILVDGQFNGHCIIRDVSNTGMRIEVQDEDDLPDGFHVKTPAMPELLSVKQAWRKRKELGVEFVAVHQPDSEEQLAG